MTLMAALSVAACKKEIISVNSQPGRLVITAQAGTVGKGDSDTKAVGEYGYQVLWEEDDQIAVTDGTSQATFSLIDGAGETVGKFEQEDGGTLSGNVTGYYPASLLDQDGTLVWPASQKYTESMSGIPMTANATVGNDGTTFRFKNLGAVLQLVLTHAEGDLPMKNITISAANAGLSGAFSVTDGAASGFTSGTAITLDCKGLVIGKAAKTVNIAIPAAVYKDLKLSFQAVDGSVLNMVSKSIEIERGVVSKVTLSLGSFESQYPDYLSFTATGADVTIGMKKFGNSTPDTIDFQYTTDLASNSWTVFTADASVSGVQSILTLPKGQTVFIRVKTARYALGNSGSGWTFDFATTGGRVIAGGNVMSLLDPSVKSTRVGDYAFRSLFQGATALVSAPALPAMTLGEFCYSGMFNGCSNLTEAPDLPAAYLKDFCYESMFANTGLKSSATMSASTLASRCCKEMYIDCKSLVSVHTLGATSLASYCYESMFAGCSSLVNAPVLPAETMAECCYQSMFESCTSIIDAPALPSMSLAPNCYDGMFMYCRSLVNAPALPATTLCEYCYHYMFAGCSSLEIAPYLPAKTLADCCYQRMFNLCSSLKSLKVNFSDWADNVTTGLPPTNCWTYGVNTENGTFCCPSDLALKYGVGYIPSGWNVTTDGIPSEVGTIYSSAGIEGIYIGTFSGKKLIFATCNLGTIDPKEFGTSYSKAELDALTLPSGWEIPTENDIKALISVGNYFGDTGTGATKMIFEDISAIPASPYWYFIPYTHNVAGGLKEARLWIKGSDPYDFYWFRSDNANGRTDLDSSSNYIRLVKRL